MPVPEGENAAGERKVRGNELGFWFFTTFFRVFGLRGAYGLLYLVCVYYALFDPGLVAAAIPYIRRRFRGCGRFAERLHAYRLFVSQGKQFIDRYAVISGDCPFELWPKGYDEFTSLLRNEKRGAILLTSHQGNWQVAMRALERVGKTVHVVMNPDENPALAQKLYPRLETGNVKIVSPKQYLGGVMEIMSALRRGEVVSMMGDRRYDTKAVEVSFLGDKAWFPYSAFRLAATAECPIVVLQTTKVSARRYVVDMSNILYPRWDGRRNKVDQLKPWVQEFVTLMGAFAEEHPYECFLFCDVWKESDGAA